MAKKVYKNTLGEIEPNCTISLQVVKSTKGYSAEKGAFETPEERYFYVSATSDCPAKKWGFKKNEEDETIKAILAEMNSDGWDCEVVCWPHSTLFRHIACTHRASAKALATQQAKQAQQTSGNYETGYIRFGLPPKSGYSINHATGEREPGISVYRAKFFETGAVVVDTPHYSQGTFLALQNYPMYQVWGELVGYGSDGEPCLKISKVKLLKK